MEVVQDYCDYIQITRGELDALNDELDQIISSISTSDESMYPILMELSRALEDHLADNT